MPEEIHYEYKLIYTSTLVFLYDGNEFSGVILTHLCQESVKHGQQHASLRR